jgi:prepilin-type N-terminal cleavage/methylation domain-containing protein
MKNLLPQTNNSKAFTLIELLVVIAIIAIISVVAVSLFSNVQADARDGKRRAELEAIANVLEVNKTTAGYQPVLAAQFGGGNFPGGDTTNAKDPQGFAYCISGTSGVANATANGITNTPSCTDANYTLMSGTQPTGNPAQYKVCTRLESRGTPSVFCRTNVQ